MGDSRFDFDNQRQNGIHLRLAHLAKQQHGPFRRDQAIALGMSESQVDYAVWDSFASHRTGGRLRGVVDRYDGLIELVVDRHHPPKLDGVEARTAALGTDDRGSVRGIPTVALARLVLQLATVLQPDQLTRAFERARDKGLHAKQVDRLLAEHKGERGTVALRELNDRYRDAKGIGRGGFEDAFYKWLLKIMPRGARQPERNAWVELSDGTMVQRDLVARDAHAIIELNYHGHHAASRAQATLDAQIARDLRYLGWRVEVVTSDEFKTDRARVRRDIGRLLGWF
jgi:hypothetical protein